MADRPPKPPQIRSSLEGDLVVLHLEGDYTVEGTKYVYAMSEMVAAEYGYHLQLMNVSKAGPITPDARRWLLVNGKATKLPGAAAIVGSNFAIRTLAQMVIRALHTLTKTPTSIRFFDHEDDARQWLAQERVRLKNELHSPPEQ